MTTDKRHRLRDMVNKRDVQIRLGDKRQILYKGIDKNPINKNKQDEQIIFIHTMNVNNVIQSNKLN